ncbi:TATA box-binding protein-associated factor RNA polymerase I subunit A, partial [Stegodyphus mimosarum]
MPAVKRCIAKEGTIPRVLEVLDLIVMSINDRGKRNKKKFQDVYTLCACKQASLCGASSLGRQCIDLTATSISSHRFETAAKLLWIVSQDKCTFETFLYRASMIIIENLNLSNESETVWNVVSNTLKLPEIKKKEVKLEYLIYGLRHNIFNSRDSLEKLFQKKSKSGPEKESILKSVFDAYLALLDYIEWYKLNYSDMQFLQRKILPEKAIATFMQVVRNPGQWDIFVLKLIEMLEFSDRSDEIEDMLIKYIECNPEHINGYIYLCVYLHDHDSESPNFIKYLKVLAELCPSDIRVLFLVEKWIISGENVKECLKHLFMFLDYPSNGQNIQAWKLLGRLLHQIRVVSRVFLNHTGKADANLGM